MLWSHVPPIAPDEGGCGGDDEGGGRCGVGPCRRSRLMCSSMPAPVPCSPLAAAVAVVAGSIGQLRPAVVAMKSAFGAGPRGRLLAVL